MESIWTRSSWEAFLFFAIGLALATTIATRLKFRLGSNDSRRRPFVFGAKTGFLFGLLLCVYIAFVSNGLETDSSVSDVWMKMRVAAFPTSAALGGVAGTAFERLFGVALVVQSTLLGTLFGGLARAIDARWFENKNVNSKNKENPSKDEE